MAEKPSENFWTEVARIVIGATEEWFGTESKLTPPEYAAQKLRAHFGKTSEAWGIFAGDGTVMSVSDDNPGDYQPVTIIRQRKR